MSTIAVADARRLAGLLEPAAFKVNLIPYNPTGLYDGSSREAIAAFKAQLDRARIPATVRLTRGREIAAACGQLAAATDSARRRAPHRSRYWRLASPASTPRHGGGERDTARDAVDAQAAPERSD